MILFPNAKINLGLNVTERRPDGYHNLETVFAPIQWRDILEIVPASANEPTTLTLSGNPVECPPEKNLVMKAFRQFEKAVGGLNSSFKIYLHKVIPDGAGLGGGSSDAAFTLIALNKLTGEPFTPDQLAEIAASIGADCPFFIYNRPMAATGIGTTFSPLSLTISDTLLAVVKPSAAVSTAEAYGGIKPQPSVEKPWDILSAAPPEWQGRLRNDFEPTVFARHDDLPSIKRHLLELGADYASMSGSGSAFFALFPERNRCNGDILTAEHLETIIKREFPDCAIHVEKPQW